jgi:predicted DNA binding CopG/RHH family protein
MAEKTITIRVEEDLHKQVKHRIIEKDMTLKDYLVDLIKKDLKKEGAEK